MTANPKSSTPETPPAAAPAAPPGNADLEQRIIEQIKLVFDPEIPVSIYELGLIYAIDIEDGGDVKIRMTLTAPGCPSAQELPLQVRAGVGRVQGVRNVDVEVVWDPPWSPAMMTDAAKLQLGMF